MAIDITWKITRLEVVDQGNLSNVAVQACFDVKGVDEENHHGFAQGDVLLGPTNPETFTEIDNVTEDQAIGWVKAALGSRTIEFENRIIEQIGWQKAPKPKVANLSWIVSENVETTTTGENDE